MKWASSHVIRFDCISMSKSKLRSAQYSINECLKLNKEYSFASQADMRHMLNRCVKDLHEQGYMVAHINGLKPNTSIFWLSIGKNKVRIQQRLKTTCLNCVNWRFYSINLSWLRPATMRIKSPGAVIPQRIIKPFIRLIFRSVPILSLEAQSLFGLRREESMKLILSDAWQGGRLKIKPSWTKGGIGRILDITNDAQRQGLSKAVQQIPTGQSLISSTRTYKQHLGHYQIQTKQMGISKCHGLRHAYTQ